MDNKLALSFRDLLELRFVDAFIRLGVSWRTMRRAHENAQQELKTTHPFCSRRIETDGKNILLRQAKEDSDEALLNLVTHQREFSRIVQDFLKELEFSGDDIIWWLLGKERQIIVDRGETSASQRSLNPACLLRPLPGASKPIRRSMKSRVGMKCRMTKYKMLSNLRSRSRRREIFLR